MISLGKFNDFSLKINFILTNIIILLEAKGY